MALPSDRMARSTFPTMCADEFTGLSIVAGHAGGAANVTPCPSAAAPAGDIVEAAAKPPEGTHPDAGAAAWSPPFPGRDARDGCAG